MRVSFLALHAPDLSPSQRYRIEAFLPHLRRRGIEVDYQWLLDREDLRVFRSDRVQDAVSTGELYVAREGATMEELTRRYQAGELR